MVQEHFLSQMNEPIVKKESMKKEYSNQTLEAESSEEIKNVKKEDPKLMKWRTIDIIISLKVAQSRNQFHLYSSSPDEIK